MEADDDSGGVGGFDSIISGQAGRQWTNVQDPVRQMITAITKAVRTQSAGLRDVDRKLGLMASQDRLDRQLEDTTHNFVSKQV